MTSVDHQQVMFNAYEIGEASRQLVASARATVRRSQKIVRNWTAYRDAARRRRAGGSTTRGLSDVRRSIANETGR
jgi:hypothetical protein